MPLPRQAFWNYLATDLIKIGRNEDASQYLANALSNAPDAELMNTLGHAFSLQGLLEEAAHCYQRVVEWAPTNYLAHFSLGKIELQRRRFEKAREHLEKARALAPEQVDVLRSLAITYQLLQQPADAMRIQESIIQVRERRRSARNPKDPWPAYAL
jgi:Flp pilus assembly protein TadD